MAHVQNAQSTSQDLTSTFNVKALTSTFRGSMVVAGIVASEPLATGPTGMIERGTFYSNRGWAFDLSLPSGGAVPARTFVSLNGATTCATVFQAVLSPK